MHSLQYLIILSYSICIATAFVSLPWLNIHGNVLRHQYHSRATQQVLSMSDSTKEGNTSITSERERQVRLQVAELGSQLKGTNLYFVGMMGTGKSTVARAMADRMGPYTFMDTDVIIEQLMKAPIDEIFEEHGEDVFREIECQVLNELHSYVKLVIATGGGIVVDKKNWSKLHSGLVVWLDMTVSDLSTRLLSNEKEVWKRPLLQASDAKMKLEQIYDDRKQMYAQADVRVSMSLEDDIDTVVLECCSALKKFINSNPPKWQEWKDAAKESGIKWVQ